jgi:FKBP-type peptidyl-prolyl cis-trans isomerase FkpA
MCIFAPKYTFMKHFLNFFLCAALCTAFLSCKDDNDDDGPSLTVAQQFTLDSTAIENYLKDKGLTAETSASGLRYIITDYGNNDNVKPASNSVVTVRYKGYFLDDKVFDETEGPAVTQFSVNGVVSGFGEGLRLLNKKGKGTFFLPSALGYGRFASGPIPANTPIVFDIELVDFF